MEELKLKIKNLAEKYSAKLNSQIELRKENMKADDTSHYLIYRVLGIATNEGQQIDEYQNIGRFLYKYAGSFLEETAILSLNYAFPNGQKTKIPNTIGQKPKNI